MDAQLADRLTGRPTDFMRLRWRPAFDGPAIGLCALVFTISLILWLDNVHLETSNGMWKSINIDEWKADFGTARLDSPNYLYYPAMALIGRLLDALGIFPGRTFKQLALINAASASIALMIVHHLVRTLTGRRDIAAIAALFQIGCGFFLVLAVTNEDIMPSFTLVLAAMAMAALWFGAPSVRQVMGVSLVFTLGWLSEWRLMFPALPPLLLALALSDGTLKRRAGLVLVFLLTMVGFALFVVNRTEGHLGAVGLDGVLWTGKGIATGWAGFSLDKLALLAAGMGEYWWGGNNISSTGDLPASMVQWLPSLLVQALLLAILMRFFWQRRLDGRWRATAIVFLGTLMAGQVMNAYSQPQDPQMQINAMPWLALAWTLPLATLPLGRGALLAVAALTALPLALNVAKQARYRGIDGRMEAALVEIERRADPARTVFVYTGFERIVAWQFLRWAHRWEGVCDLGPAPLATPKFKWISLFGSSVHHPSWTPAEHAAALKAQLDCAFDKGYRVVAGPVWNITADGLAGWMASLGGHDTALALYAVMHEQYRAAPIAGFDFDGVYSDIARRPEGR